MILELSLCFLFFYLFLEKIFVTYTTGLFIITCAYKTHQYHSCPVILRVIVKKLSIVICILMLNQSVNTSDASVVFVAFITRRE